MPGKRIAVEVLRVLLLAEDQAAARAAKRFVRGGGNEVGVRHGARMHARGDEAGDVRHVDEEQRADGARDFAHTREIDDARIGARADDDHFRFVLVGEAVEFVVVDGFGFLRYAVRDELVRLAGEIQRMAVR